MYMQQLFVMLMHVDNFEQCIEDFASLRSRWRDFSDSYEESATWGRVAVGGENLEDVSSDSSIFENESKGCNLRCFWKGVAEGHIGFCLGSFCVTFVKNGILPTLAYPPPGQPRQTFLRMYRAKRLFA